MLNQMSLQPLEKNCLSGKYLKKLIQWIGIFIELKEKYPRKLGIYANLLNHGNEYRMFLQ